MGNTGAIGHAERVHPTRPGNLTTTVHRGRCTLRPSAKRTLRHMTQRVWKIIPQLPAHPTAPLKLTLRNHRRGRRPRRPLRWITDGVIAVRKRSPYVVGRTVPGAPLSVDGQRYCTPPTLHQPLSHGAKRRDSSPFRGAEGWEEACGVYASVYHDADTYVAYSPVRGGVLDTPRLRDCRAALDASVRRGRLQPRLLRCAR